MKDSRVFLLASFLPGKRIILLCSRGGRCRCRCEMTLLFYSAAQIDEDKRMKGAAREGRGRRWQWVASWDEIGSERLSDDNGVFSPYGVVPSTQGKATVKSGRQGGKWSPQMLFYYFYHLKLRHRTGCVEMRPCSNRGNICHNDWNVRRDFPT